jgi:hypothetical protein
MAGTGRASAGSASASAAAAAGGSPSASPAGTVTLTGSAASALASRALADTQHAASVRVAGKSANAGSGSQSVTFDLTLVKNAGCQGTIALSKTESFKIVETGGYVWLLPTDAFYTSLHMSKAALALVQDKYIKVKSTDTQLGDLAKICSFSGLFGSIPKVTGTGYTATPTTYLGRAAYKLTQAGNKGSAFISNTTTPLVLQITDPTSGGGVITFSNYGAAVKITPPTAAESIDGSQLGL